MKKLLDRNDPFFRKPVVRVITVAWPILWGAFEVYSGSPGWGLIFLALGAYAAWVLFLAPD